MILIASVLLEPLKNLLNILQAESHYQNDKKDEALSLINQALIETKRYIEESEGAKCFDRERERELAKLWSEASIKTRYASRDFAASLQDKSFYWSDELKWSREEVMSKQIDIDSIQEQFRNLIQK